MNNPSKIQVWLAQIRANFLLLAFLLAVLGTVLAWHTSLQTGISISGLDIALMIIGNVIAHASVDLFNEYSDNKRTQIDYNTIRNPFSGGSGMMIAGHTSPRSVLAAAIGTLVAALAIGIYFVITAHWFLIVLISIGAITIVVYTDGLAKILLGEFFAGLTLGTFVVLGTYIGLTAKPDMAISELLPTNVILFSIAPGILTALLLFLNEFPDMDADKKGGRFHLVIFFGKKRSAYVYCFGLLLVYLSIIIIPLTGNSSYFALVGLLSIPLEKKAGSSALKHYNDIPKIIQAMGVNIGVVLLTDLLLSISVVLSIIFIN